MNLKLGHVIVSSSDWMKKRNGRSYAILFQLKKINVIQHSPRNGYREL